MDGLELLKKDWQEKEKNLPKLSYDEIYGMLWCKSSSFVKWIFYISIAEFLFWFLLNRIPAFDGELLENTKYLDSISMVAEVVSYIIILYFVVAFYRNYKKITTTDSSRKLMKNILNVRKTVMRYVWINLALFAVYFLVLGLDIIFFETGLNQFNTTELTVHPWVLNALFLGAIVIAIVLVAALLWLFYRIIYGILLKRLNENYRELKKLEL